MIAIKIIIFISIIVSVKMISIVLLKEEDNKIKNMKEIARFVDSLKVYSCNMRMSIQEITNMYKFKSDKTKSIIVKFNEELKDWNSSTDNVIKFTKYIEDQIGSPEEFNNIFCEIFDFYGKTLADVLDNKLLFIRNKMMDFIEEYEKTYKDRKKLVSKLSLLVGSLIAIILI